MARVNEDLCEAVTSGAGPGREQHGSVRLGTLSGHTRVTVIRCPDHGEMGRGQLQHQGHGDTQAKTGDKLTLTKMVMSMAMMSP